MAKSDKEPVKAHKKRSGVVLFLRDAGVAALIVALILLAMFAFTGKWPPLVVVESNSMMHGEDNHSHLGVIDTGDLVLVKKVDSPSDIETYLDGFVSGHRTYGDYGDVIIYRPFGESDHTPIIHRAMVYLEANPDGSSYRVTALRDIPADKWAATNSLDTWDHLTSVLTIFHVGWDDISVTINVQNLAQPFASGYITKGDHNSQVDFGSSPVRLSWVVGMARGEIPWFGLLKLWSTHTLGSDEPQNSVVDLSIAVILIVLCPILFDVGMTFKEKRDIEARREAARRNRQEPPTRSMGKEKDGGRGR